MRKLIVSEFMTLDGVIQAPGHKDEDRDGGFQQTDLTGEAGAGQGEEAAGGGPQPTMGLSSGSGSSSDSFLLQGTVGQALASGGPGGFAGQGQGPGGAAGFTARFPARDPRS